MADWKKEAARDLFAMGSLPFYLLVVIRTIIGEDWLFVAQSIIALVILFLFSKIVEGNQYLARGLILFIFTSLFYTEELFTLFAFALLIVLIFSLDYLKVRRIMVLNGLILGMASVLIGFHLAPLLVQQLFYLS